MPNIQISTQLGDIVIRLYDETPKHRDNFLKLVGESFYNGTLFHRVISGFMIQGGVPDSREATAEETLGKGDSDYTIEAEILPNLYHKRGALAAARLGDEVNPERRSSGSQFYIVWGTTYNEEQLRQIEQQRRKQAEQLELQTLIRKNRERMMTLRRNREQESLMLLQEELTRSAKTAVQSLSFSFSEEAKKSYTTIGGTPFLDGQYTVFGEVIEGLDVVEQIQAVNTRSADRPVEDIVINNIFLSET